MFKTSIILLFLILNTDLFAGRLLTPFQASKLIRESSLEEFKERLDAEGFDLDQDLGYNGERIIHLAMEENNREIAMWVIKNSSDLNKCTRYGSTPLINAITSNKPDYVRALTENGADIDLIPPSGRSPVRYRSRYR